MLFDNVSGTGRPIAATYIENVGITYASSIAQWYRDSATALGRWGAYVNNNNSNGIRRIEIRDHLTGNLKYVLTDADGQWGSVNTVNATSGSTPLILPNNLTETFVVNGNVKLSAGKSLEVTGTLTNNGTITLEATSKTDYARLIYGAVSGTGTVNHQMRLTPGSSFKWYALGSPVDGINVNSIGTGQFTSTSVYNWSATGGWTSAHTGTFTRGQGVFIAAGENSPYGFFTIPSDDTNIVFTGVLSANTADVVRTMDYGTAPTGVTFTTSETQGWNLLANPYHADFDLNGLTSDNDSPEKSLSIRTPTGYISYNPSTNTPLSARYLSPGEAFFVRATATGQTFTFALSRRTSSGGDGLLKTQNNFDRVNVRVSKNDRKDEMYVLFKSDATTEFDGQYDAYKFTNIDGYPMLYSVLSNKMYSINTLQALSGAFALPTHFKCSEAGAYTISLFDVSDFDPSIIVTLEDKMTNTLTVLNNGDYTFTHYPTNNPDRFVLHFNKSTVSTSEQEADKFNAWVYEGVLYVKGFENLGNTRLSVTDMSGRVVFSTDANVQSGIRNEIALPKLAAGVYVLRVEAGAQQKAVKIVVP
ncbi:hypothetical protein JCM31826_01550 [Thermaurantimonas aggregans]|uniref:Secretion system C-terminal sorting domain-containing protein n=1 Tax=Thermaurantimonas aggregans TaxID=2173829 RepID=A0A401XI38_9FLAO|nr:hypothetical protein JCM31826_01550 [Thermaurantimonas aggregans]